MMTKQSIDTDQKEYLRCVDSAFGFAIAKKLTEFKTSENGFRTAGTTAEKEAAARIGQTMQEAGQMTQETQADLKRDPFLDYRISLRRISAVCLFMLLREQQMLMRNWTFPAKSYSLIQTPITAGGMAFCSHRHRRMAPAVSFVQLRTMDRAM